MQWESREHRAEQARKQAEMEARARDGQWAAHFAWWPVELSPPTREGLLGRVAWLEWVERADYYSFPGGQWPKMMFSRYRGT